MPVHVDPSHGPAPVCVAFSGDVSVDEIEAQFADLARLTREVPSLLVDFRKARLDITHSGFMQLADRWFSAIGADVRTAVVFDEAETDRAMLLSTKAFLAGAIVKSFFDTETARAWLSAGSGPQD